MRNQSGSRYYAGARYSLGLGVAALPTPRHETYERGRLSILLGPDLSRPVGHPRVDEGRGDTAAGARYQRDTHDATYGRQAEWPLPLRALLTAST